MDPFDEMSAPAVAEVRPGARWPWLALAAGVVIVVVGGVAFSPEPPATGGQPASLAVPAAP